MAHKIFHSISLQFMIMTKPYHTYYIIADILVELDKLFNFILFFYQTSNSYKIYTYNYIYYNVQSRDTFSFNLFIFKNIPINIGYT